MLFSSFSLSFLMKTCQVANFFLDISLAVKKRKSSLTLQPLHLQSNFLLHYFTVAILSDFHVTMPQQLTYYLHRYIIIKQYSTSKSLSGYMMC